MYVYACEYVCMYESVCGFSTWARFIYSCVCVFVCYLSLFKLIKSHTSDHHSTFHRRS